MSFTSRSSSTISTVRGMVGTLSDGESLHASALSRARSPSGKPFAKRSGATPLRDVALGPPQWSGTTSDPDQTLPTPRRAGCPP